MNAISPAAWLASSLIVLAFCRCGKATRQLRNPLLFSLAIFAGKISLFPFLMLANRVGRGDGLLVVAKTTDGIYFPSSEIPSFPKGRINP